MDKRQKKAWRECDLSGCGYMVRCMHYWGSNCKNLGGKRIPRMKPKYKPAVTLVEPINTYPYRFFTGGSKVSTG